MTWVPQQSETNLDPAKEDVVVNDAVVSSYRSLTDLSLDNIPLTSSGQNGTQTAPVSPSPVSTQVAVGEGIALNRASLLSCSPFSTFRGISFL